MCGRYVLNAPEDLSERFQLRQLAITLPHSWNVSPTSSMPVIIEIAEEGRQGRTMKWGLIPRWSKPGDTKAIAPINARAETLAEKPMFRGLIKNRRCLVPANGFYEWKKTGNYKQPYFISVADNDLFTFAGLYDESKGEEGDVVASYTIITTSANDVMSSIHDRMPVILDEEDEDEWLDSALTDAGAIRHLLGPYPADKMVIYPVSREVNNVRNNRPELIEQIDEKVAGQARS
ncbi:SOS response-associated peptidase [soil metagenome]